MASPSSQSGNIFFYIFLGIVLFAALGYAVSRSSINAYSVSDQKAKLLAAEIIAQGNMFKDAVSKIRLRGYSENALSFYAAAPYNVYTNTSCTEAGCRIFDPDGGNVTPPRVPTEGQIAYAKWEFAGTYYVIGNGLDTKSDLFAGVGNITKVVCEQINKILGISSIYFRSGNPSTTRFSGSYNDNGPIYLTNGAMLNGKAAACIQVSQPGGAFNTLPENNYIYYQVLQAR